MPKDSIQDGNRPQEPRQYRTLFVSDIHLGARACQADAFLDFLRHNEAETIYLAGDIVDFWSLKRTPVGCNRITTSCKSSCGKPARERGSSSSPAITMKPSAPIAA